jgi:protein SCO1/2
MKKYLITAAISLALIFIAFFILDFTGLNNKTHQSNIEKLSYAKETQGPEKEDHSCCSSEEETEEFSENSIYQLESDLSADKSGKAGWIDQSGKKFSLAQLEGKPVVLTMFFASCTYACPILVNDMKKIESEIPENELSSYMFVLISIDPERDTPQKLAKFAQEKNLDTKRWTLLTGNSDEIMELAALIGFKYKKDNKGDFFHSNLITFLNKEGEIIHQQVGLNQDITESTKVLLAQNKL